MQLFCFSQNMYRKHDVSPFAREWQDTRDFGVYEVTTRNKVGSERPKIQPSKYNCYPSRKGGGEDWLRLNALKISTHSDNNRDSMPEVLLFVDILVLLIPISHLHLGLTNSCVFHVFELKFLRSSLLPCVSHASIISTCLILWFQK